MGTVVKKISATNTQARISHQDARRIFEHVMGMTAAQAITALRFTPSLVCPAVARLVDEGVVLARGIPPELLVLADYKVGEGEPVIRVRRHAHGNAGWITTPTTAITLELVEVHEVRSIS